MKRVRGILHADIKCPMCFENCIKSLKCTHTGLTHCNSIERIRITFPLCFFLSFSISSFQSSICYEIVYSVSDESKNRLNPKINLVELKLKLLWQQHIFRSGIQLICLFHFFLFVYSTGQLIGLHSIGTGRVSGKILKIVLQLQLACLTL